MGEKPTGLTDELVAQLKGETPTESIDLSGRKLQSADLKVIAKSIKGNTHLKRLNLADNYITDHGANFKAVIKLAEALPHASLTALDISKNNVTNFGNDMECLVKLVEVLPQTSIRELNLAGNHAYKRGLGEDSWGLNQDVFTKLAEVLPTSSVTSLNMADNRIELEPLRILAESLPKSKVTSLDVSHNRHIDKNALAAIKKLAPSVEMTGTEPTPIVQVKI